MHITLPGFSGEASLHRGGTYLRRDRMMPDEQVVASLMAVPIDCDCYPDGGCYCCVFDSCCFAWPGREPFCIRTPLPARSNSW